MSLRSSVSADPGEALRAGRLITLPTFAEPQSGVRHFFGTRPQEPGGNESVQVSWLVGGSANAARNSGGRRGSAITVVSVKQVHGTDVLVLDQDAQNGDATPQECDALITNRSYVLLTVRTADCVPLLIYDPVHRVVAAIHAGWRGAVAGIVPKTLLVLHRRFGSDPASLRLGIGPSVGQCCYEVDKPVLDRLRANFTEWGDVVREVRTGVALMDLQALVRRQAEGEGVKPECIARVKVCTVCHPDLFYSYRREGMVVGTMVSGIMLTGRTARS